MYNYFNSYLQNNDKLTFGNNEYLLSLRQKNN